MVSWLSMLIGSQVVGLSLKATVSVPLASALAFRIQAPERADDAMAAAPLNVVRLVSPVMRRMSLTSLEYGQPVRVRFLFFLSWSFQLSCSSPPLGGEE